ncbi:MAG TPA: YqaE/Pmp3 family membrane protein, partial [Bacteroidia bacterium]|nr:YqaE/Pmp3 family membrane protein [Bacteroidia bacterium]
IFLSSCATQQKDIFSKRKYYNFPRTKHIISNQPEELAVTKVKPILFSTKHTSTEKAVEPPVTASANQHTPAVPKKEIMPQLKKVISTTNVVEVKEAKPNVSSHKNILNKTISSHSLFSSDGMLILLIILAIILPPLGVYMKNNNAVNKWFWVTLVLCLLGAFGWGFLIIGLGGVLWFAAAIIALLFVFDAI